MPICGSTGFLAYNLTDLAPYGFITKKLVLEWPVGKVPSAQQLARPRAGQSFKKIEKKDAKGYPYFIYQETRILLPAPQLYVEFYFRTSTKSNNISIAGNSEESGNSLIGLGGLGGGAGFLALALTNDRFFGGTESFKWQQCWHLTSSTTRFDIPIIVDDKVKANNGIIELPGYILSILGAFQEPLALSKEQKAKLGEPVNGNRSVHGYAGDGDGYGVFNGKIIDGGGLYLNKPIPPIFPKNSSMTSRQVFNSKNLLKQVVKDTRLNVFRADNQDFSTKKYTVPFNTMGQNDLGTKKIQIDITPYKSKKDATVYVTACLATKRYMREFNNHRADFAELPSVGGFARQGFGPGSQGNILPLLSLVTSWHFYPVTWRVKKTPVLENASVKRMDSAYLNSIKVGMEAFDDTQEQLAEDKRTWEKVEGWRINEVCDTAIDSMFVGDMNGISLAKKGIKVDGLPTPVTLTLIMSSGEIKDQEWWLKYLKDNRYENTSFEKTGLRESEFAGSLIDVSEHVNTVLHDNQKTPYHRKLALALKSIDKSKGIGCANLDLQQSGFLSPATAKGYKFDLSSAVFIPSGAAATNPGSWAADTCSSETDLGSYYDPLDANNRFSFAIPLAAGSFYTEWLMRTPFYRQKFDRSTRVFVEFFRPHGISYNPSQIYVYTVPQPESSLALDTTAYHDETFAFFENLDNDVIANYSFSDGYVQKCLNRSKPYPQGNHERPEYDYKQFKMLGFSMALGQIPNYSEGSFSSRERIEICNGKKDSTGKDVTFESIYKTGSFKIPVSIANTSYEISGVAEDSIYRDLTLEYELDVGFSSSVDDKGVTRLKSGASEIADSQLSIQFKSRGMVIDNISLPYVFGKHRVIIDGRFYGGSPIVLHSDMLPYMKNIKLSYVSTTVEKIKPYFINGKQLAVGIDGKNSIHVFYSDEDSNNISCAVSSDMGATWWRFKDILRLTESEHADLPYVISDKDTNEFILFYRLNSQFLMVKKIKSEWFNCPDQFLTYTPIKLFNESSPDNLGVEQYSELGKQLRQQESFFIHALKSDEYFKTETKVSRSRRNSTTLRTARFVFSGNVDGVEGTQMDSSFDGGTYAAYKDRRGKYRVVFTMSDGKVNLKTNGGDISSWYYDVKNMIIHKNFFNDDPLQVDLSIDNPQIVYDDICEDVYLFYIHNQSLFYRKFDNNLLYGASSGGSFAGGNSEFVMDDRVRKHVEIVRESNNLPVFVVGTLTEELSNGIKADDANPNDPKKVSVVFSYKEPDKFLDKYQIDVNSKPVGYSLRNGVIRLLYRAEDGYVHGATLNGGIPTLDVKRRYNPSDIPVEQ